MRSLMAAWDVVCWWVLLLLLLPPLQSEYAFRVQMLEIYNENLRDLLVDGRGGVNRLDILATQASGCNVPGATQVRPCSSCVAAAVFWLCFQQTLSELCLTTSINRMPLLPTAWCWCLCVPLVCAGGGPQRG